MKSYVRVAALSFAFGFAGLGAAWLVAEDPPAAEPAAPAAEAPAEEGQTLTAESLESMLTAMNYKVTRQEAGAGGPFFTVRATVAGTKYTITVCVMAEDPRLLYFSMALGTVEDPTTVTADRSLGLLAENNKITPAHFAFDPELQRFFLFKVIPNSGITKQQMLREFGSIATISARAEALWGPAK